MRTGHNLQLREGLLYPRRAGHRRRAPGDLQEECPEGHRSPGPATGGQ